MVSIGQEMIRPRKVASVNLKIGKLGKRIEEKKIYLEKNERDGICTPYPPCKIGLIYCFISSAVQVQRVMNIVGKYFKARGVREFTRPLIGLYLINNILLDWMKN